MMFVILVTVQMIRIVLLLTIRMGVGNETDKWEIMLLGDLMKVGKI